MAEKESNLSKRPLNKLKCDKKRHECSECEYSSNDKKTLKRHVMRKHTLERPYKCTFCNCNYSAVFQKELKAHMNTHTLEITFTCDICGYKCNHRHTMYMHKRKHLMTDEALQEEALKKSHKCPHCDYATNNKSRFTDHVQAHSNILHFKCVECEYASNTKRALDNHIARKHSVAKDPQKCTKCDFTAKTKGTMDKHTATCKGLRPYTCTKCEYSTAVLKNLYQHAETHLSKE